MTQKKAKKALSDIGWTQARIAKAKGVAQTFVSFRLKLADLPEKALDQFITKDILNERQARELLKLYFCDNLEVWLPRETAMIEILESVLKNDKDKITAKVFAKEVELEEIFRLKGKENQKTSTGGSNPRPCQISDKAGKIDTKKELAKIAGVSHDTIAKGKKVRDKATEEVREKVKKGEVSINEAYKDIKKGVL